MRINQLNWLSEGNPQIFRELKGRLKPRNILIAVAMSLVGQLLVFMSFARQIPTETYQAVEKYCRLQPTYQLYQKEYYQVQNQISPYTQVQPKLSPEKTQELQARFKELQQLINDKCPIDQINFQQWWLDQWPGIFVCLSLFAFFILLGVGAYMLIDDLAKEDRRGTLNFIRLSPQSSRSVLIGKMLGVPVLLYLAALVALPFHVWAGLSASIPAGEIFSFYAVVMASCAFFYSAALLFGLGSAWLGGFQSWLGAGTILIFLMVFNHRQIEQSPFDWLNLFNPSFLLPYLLDRTGSTYLNLPFSHGPIQKLEWFYLPVGATGAGMGIFLLLNYGLWTYWIGQSLSRRFRSDQATLLSKKQSYLVTACFTLMTLGFALQPPRQWLSSQFVSNLHALLMLMGLLFICLIAALSPQRQTLQDWARYFKDLKQKGEGKINHSGLQGLIWGEKSPSVVAITINLLITATPVVCWILLWSVGSEHKIEALSSVALTLSFIIICASIFQLMLLMKTPKRALWAAGVAGSAIFLPPFILSVLSVNPGSHGGSLWLLTAFSWGAVKYASETLVFQVLLVQWTCLGLLNWQLSKQLRKAGESASKALLAGKN